MSGGPVSGGPVSGGPPGEHLSDEDISALVDGSLVSAGVAGHAAACPECAARLGRWRASLVRVGEAVTIPGRARDAAVAAALGASGSMMDAIARLDDERARRAGRRGYERWKVLSRVAAVAVVMSAAGFGLSRLSSSSPKAASSGAAVEAPTSSAASGGSGPGISAQAGSGSASAPHTPAAGSGGSVDLGSLSGPADVARSVRAALGTGRYRASKSSAGAPTAESTQPVANASARCPGPLVGTGSHLLLIGDAVYQHTSAVVYVMQTGAVRTATVYGDSDCRILVRTTV